MEFPDGTEHLTARHGARQIAARARPSKERRQSTSGGRTKLVSVLIASRLLYGGMVSAQTGAETGLAGFVRDSAGTPVPGAAVTASSAALMEASRASVTDAAGRYQIDALSPGIYTITFTRAGFKTVERRGVRVRTWATARVDEQLPAGDATEVVVVTSQVPLLDVRSASAQRVVARDLVNDMPVASLFTDLGIFVPGMSVTGTGQPNYQDVGGSTGNAYGVLAIHGGRFSDQMVKLAGMSVVRWDGAGSVSALSLPDQRCRRNDHRAYRAAGRRRDRRRHRQRRSARRRKGVPRGRAGHVHVVGALQFDNQTPGVPESGLPDQNRIRVQSKTSTR